MRMDVNIQFLLTNLQTPFFQLFEYQFDYPGDYGLYFIVQLKGAGFGILGLDGDDDGLRPFPGQGGHVQHIDEADVMEGDLELGHELHVLGPEPEDGAGRIARLDRVYKDKEVGGVEIGYQLMADDPRLDQSDVRRDGDLAEGVDDMNAEAVIGQQQIADTQDQNISGRRFTASPHFIGTNHLSLFF
jgi:hypothetical protein